MGTNNNHSQPQLFTRIVSVAITGLGVVVFFGWALDIAALKTVLPGLVSMKVNTALGMLLAGLSLYLMTISGASRIVESMATLLALLVVVLGVGTLSQDIFGWDLGIDQILFKEAADALFTPHPGRMSLLAAISFSIVGAALFFLRRKTRPLLAQGLALFSLMVAALPLGGYLFGDPSFPHIGPFTAMAVHTAFGFLLLSVGILLETSEYGVFTRLQKKVHSITIGCAVVLLLLCGLASYVNMVRQVEDNRWVVHTHKVQAELQGIYINLDEIISDLRGFLLTGDVNFNATANEKRDYLWNHFNTALELTQDNPNQQSRLPKLKSLLNLRLGFVDELINLARDKGNNAISGGFRQEPRDALDNQIHDLLEKMIKTEKVLLEERQAKAEASNYSTFLALLLSGIVGLGLIFLVLKGLRQQITERKKTEEAMSIAAVAFETHEAIMITDVDGNIIRVNRAFERVTGYSEEEVIGKNPSIFSSDRHNHEFYEAMWQTLLKDGVWEGEIWDRHKNGKIYPKQLTITAVRNSKGETTQYVAIFDDISERKKTEEDIRQLAFYDALTNLPNRRLLLDRLALALLASARSQQFGALLFLDLDNFKILNDTLGHAYGDMLLVEVAKRIKLCVRGTDTVARLGGDEFVILIENVSVSEDDTSQHIAQVAEKVRAALAKPYQLKENVHHSSPSIGVCLFRGNDQSIDELVKRADMAMYQAKYTGRNRVLFYDPKMQHSVEIRAALESSLREAILDHQLRLFYQIQLDRNCQPIGAEALVRWIHPVRGITSPADFISVAEESTLILDIGHWVLDTACQQLAMWSNNENTRDLVLAVNISAKQFKQIEFVDQIATLIQKYHIKPSKLKLELTESVALHDIDVVAMKMRALSQETGVSLSLDDFGTGYSSLSYLKRLPLDQIKIDQSFVRDMTEDASDAVMVKTIIDMAHNFGLNVIAEGVETEEQFSMVKENGCMAFQGYLFGEPLPVEEFEALLT